MLEHRDRGSRAAFTPLSESRARSTRVPRVATGHLVSLAIAALLGLAFATACGKPRELTAADRGEVIYPNLPGPLGPAIAGSSRALIEARVLHGTYPPGYHPQRHSHTMRALPWLDGHIDDLTAYLAAAAHPAG